MYNPNKIFGVTTLDIVRANTFVAELKVRETLWVTLSYLLSEPLSHPCLWEDKGYGRELGPETSVLVASFSVCSVGDSGPHRLRLA